MGRRVSVLALLAVAAAQPPTCEAADRGGRNLLRNPGFEEALTRGGGQTTVPTDWQLHVYTPPDLEIVLDQTTAHAGKNSVKIVASVPRPKLGAAVAQSVRGIRPGAAYRLSGWILLSDLRAGNRPGAACIQLNFCDTNKRRLKLYDGSTRQADGWQYVSVVGTAPEKTEWITVSCVFGGKNTDGVMWYDDLELVEVKPETEVKVE